MSEAFDCDFSQENDHGLVSSEKQPTRLKPRTSWILYPNTEMQSEIDDGKPYSGIFVHTLAGRFSILLVVIVMIWNWALGLFLFALLPWVYGLHRLRHRENYGMPSTVMWLLVGLVAVYALSPGPFLVFATSCDGLFGSDITGAGIRYFYLPHQRACTSAMPTVWPIELLGEYISRWGVAYEKIVG